eukprot:NODE_119_length_18186_cov_1.929397.p2 type:complete len:454 gc:universal NODE_119_length_18186_cov_1.929397:7158-8519(+)
MCHLESIKGTNNILFEMFFTLLTLIYSKQLSLFIDGTWANLQSNTSIGKLFHAHPGIYSNYTNSQNITTYIKMHQHQIAFYLTGLGHETDITMKYVQGLSGYGLENYILVLYEFLVDYLLPNDQFYIFGFSRGAETARILSKYLFDYGIHPNNINLITTTLLHPYYPSEKGWIPQIKAMGLFDSVRAISTAQGVFNLIKSQIALDKRDLQDVQDVQDTIQNAQQTVQQTVQENIQSVQDNVSNNIKEAKENILQKGLHIWHKISHMFKSNTLIKYSDELQPNVLKCIHLVAINEYRSLFNYSSIDTKHPNYTLRYFVGSHGDLGGYYNNNRSLIALNYLVSQIDYLKSFDLSPFYPNGLQLHSYDYPIYDSYSEPLKGYKNMDAKAQFLLPLFERNFVNYTQNVDESVKEFAMHYNITLLDVMNRSVIMPLLRVADDYLSGNTSVVNVTLEIE